MPSKNRLTRADFNKISPSIPSRRFSGVYISLSVTRIPEGTSSKCAFIVSKKVSNSAVKRNLIKRRLRAIAQEGLKIYPEGYRFVFNAKKPALESTFSNLKKEAVSFFKNLTR